VAKLLIVKTGNTVPSLISAGEDFEDWIIAGCGLASEQFDVVSVHQGATLPAPGQHAGVIVTGSPAYVTDREPWSEGAGGFLREALRQEIPILAICYGHQLLAHALGGKVDFHPGGREIGTVKVTLTGEAARDPLFADLPAEFPAHVSHSQSVLELPKGAVLLAYNAFEPHHAFRVGRQAWGVQFHPEFSERVIRAYLTDRRQQLLLEGLDPGQLAREVQPTAMAGSLLGRFAQLVAKSQTGASQAGTR